MGRKVSTVRTHWHTYKTKFERSKGASLPNLYSNALVRESPRVLAGLWDTKRLGRTRQPCSVGTTGNGFYQRRLERGMLLALLAVACCQSVLPFVSYLVALTSAIRTTTTTSAAAPATVPPAAAATAVAGHLGEARVDLLLGLSENIDKVPGLLGVYGQARLALHGIRGYRAQTGLTVSGEERNGRALGAGTTSTSNPVDVILRVIGVVVVQHVSDVANVLSRGKKKEKG